jgi:AraC family transcriptional regulator
MPAADATPLLATPLVEVHDLTGPLDDGPPAASCLLFTYRGALCLRANGQVTIADPGQVVLLDAGGAHPCEPSGPTVAGSLRIQVDASLLREIASPTLLAAGEPLRFQVPRLPIDPRAQALVALLRQGLRAGIADALEGESLALTLVQRAIGPRTARSPGSTRAAQRLVDRAKLVLAADLARRWTLAQVAAEVGVSPVYLTQVFHRVEGVPLYRYQLRLRLARALDLIATHGDLSSLALDLGFSSHSHFAAAFQQTYARTPSQFREQVLRRRGSSDDAEA